MRLRWVLLSPLCALSTIGVVATAPEADCPATKAAAWVQENHDQLPTTRGELARYSAVYQGAILSHLDGRTRGRLWREHFEEVLVTHTSFTPAQRRIVELVRDSVSVWMQLDPLTARTRVSPVNEQARNMFADSIYKSVFFHLTETPSELTRGIAEGGLWGGATALAGVAARLAVGKTAVRANCNCTFDGGSTGCAPGKCVWGPNTSCVEVQNCGWLRLFYCDAECNEET